MATDAFRLSWKGLGNFVVPHSADDVTLPSSSSPKRGGIASSRKRKVGAGQESPLVSLGLESKRARLIREGLSEEATAFISDNISATKTRQRYEPAQQEFQQWLKDGSYERGINPAIVVVNWLCHTMAAKKPQWSSVLNRKAAVLALFLHPEDITSDPVFRAFLSAGHSLGIVDTKHEIYSIDPVLAFFRASPDNYALTMVDLARKLSWLLVVCGFMRSDDIFCTDVAKSGVVGDRLQLAVVFPKEKRGKQRIIKYVHLSKHVDLAICPVQAFTAYRAHTMSMDVPVPHPKDDKHSTVPLLRNSKKPSEPIGFTTISVYMNTISRLFVPKGTRPPKLRAL
ncbi:hypothetical protein BGX33_012593, partial [Mortierella sp. NVP41]